MASTLTPLSRNPVFNTAPQKRLSRPVVIGLTVAGIVHLGLAAYIIHERFEIKAAETPEGTRLIEGTFLTIEPKKPDPTPPAEVRKSPVRIHDPKVVTPTATSTIDATPAPAHA